MLTIVYYMRQPSAVEKKVTVTTKLKRNPRGGTLIPTSAIGAAYRKKHKPNPKNIIQAVLRLDESGATVRFQYALESKRSGHDK